MVMTRKQYEEIRDRYQEKLGLLEDNWPIVLEFAQELLAEEAKAIEDNEPYATETIKRLLQAETEIFNLQQEILDEDFNEGEEK